ncbi:hypothetical protein ACHAXR_013452 [Thalassiosira sp. AJA248-18]
MAEAQPSCCPEGSWGGPLGVSHGLKSLAGVNGNLFMIGPTKNLQVYVAKPESDAAKKAIMVFTDVYGLQNRLFAILDKLARDLNCPIVAIDCFRGETKDKHLNDFLDWTRKHPFEDAHNEHTTTVYPVSKDIGWCYDFLSLQFGVDPSNVGAIGFCWGVWALTKACAMGINFKCGVGFHPSLKFEDMAFGMDQLSMAKLASERAPLLFCVAGNDLDNLKPPDGDVAQIISSSNHNADGLNNQQPQCVEFPDMLHGWVSRGDTSIERVRDDAEKALNIASKFLDDWM